MENLKLISNILENEFKFKPEESRLIYNNHEEWKILTRNSDKNIRGLFQPRLLTAHVCLEPSETLMASIIHEYFGHGSYCEHTLNGKKIVAFERRLKEIENNLAGIELPIGARINIIEGNSGLITSKDTDFDYTLSISKEKSNEYLALKQYYENFYKENMLTYEGFAVWLEEFLLLKSGNINIWEKRLNEINGSPYELFYKKFKEFESKNGLLSLIYRVGFPKQFDSESIKKVVSEHIPLDKLDQLILYGSKRDYGDIDLLCILKDSKDIDKIYTEDLDISLFTKKELQEKINFFDIEITQPLLTGELIIGDKYIFENNKNKLMNIKFSDEAYKYLTRRALEAYNYSLNFYNKGFYEYFGGIIKEENSEEKVKKALNNQLDFVSGQFLHSLTNLSYVWSYVLARNLYKDNYKPLTLEQLLKITNNKPLEEIINLKKNIKRDLELPKRFKTKELIEKTKIFIRENI